MKLFSIVLQFIIQNVRSHKGKKLVIEEEEDLLNNMIVYPKVSKTEEKLLKN